MQPYLEPLIVRNRDIRNQQRSTSMNDARDSETTAQTTATDSKRSFAMNRHLTPLAAILALVFATVLVGLPAFAQSTVIWNGVNMDWTEPDSDSWSGSTYTSGDHARFTGSGQGAVNVQGGGVNPATTTVTSGAYTFTGGPIAGTLANSGTLTLNSANSFSAVTASGGTLNLGDDAAAGSAAIAFTAATTLNLTTTGSGNYGNNLTTNGTGTITISARNNLGTNTHTLGTLSIGGNQTLRDNRNSGASSTSPITVNFGTVTLGGNATFDLNSTSGVGSPLYRTMWVLGAVNETGVSRSLTKISSQEANHNILRLSAAGNYSGGTTVNAGTLEATATGALGSGPVTINGGTLDATADYVSSYTGTTIAVNGGRLIARTSNALRTGATGNAPFDITLAAGTELFLNNPTSTTFNNNIATTGNGTITIRMGNYDISSVTNTLGTLTIGGNQTLRDNRNVPTNPPKENKLIFGAVTLGGNATFDVNGATWDGLSTWVLGPISETGGSRSLTKISSERLQASTLILSGAGTFTGDTRVTGGTLKLEHNLAIQNSAFDTSGGGTFNLTSVNTPTFGGLKGGNNLALPTNVTALTLNVGTGLTHTYSGNLGGSNASLTKSGLGTQVLAGANTYTGATSIESGTVSASNIVVGGGASNLGNAASAVSLGSAGAQGALSYTGNSATYTRGFIIGGAGGGRLDVTTAGQTLTIATGGVNGTGLLTVGGAGNTTINSNLTHTGGLTKLDGGTLTLAGDNGYTGATSIQGGTVVLSGSLAAGSAVSVGNATLKGIGLAGGTVTVNAGGTLAPGASIGSLGSGDLALTDGSIFEYEFNSASLAGDLAYVTGTVDLTGEVTLVLDELASGKLSAGNKLTLISSTDDWNGGLFTYQGSLLADDSIFTLGSNKWLFNYNDTTGGDNFAANQLGAINFITMTTIPEPSAALLLALGGLVALRRRR